MDSAITIVLATLEHLPAIKKLADAHRKELSFITAGAFRELIQKQECKIALSPSGDVIGFVRYHLRRDRVTTLYEIAVDPAWRGQCIGTQLIVCVPYDIALRLKCPVENPANAFYEGLGFAYIGTEEGKKRALNVWQMIPQPTENPLYTIGYSTPHNHQ